MRMLAAALPTNQSPARTSSGVPFNEYGCRLVAIIGKRENITRPAPRAPLDDETSVTMVVFMEPKTHL